MARGPFRLQRSEQYRTSSQQRAHFFRQLKGNPQEAHVLTGSVSFLCMVTTGRRSRQLKGGNPSRIWRGFGWSRYDALAYHLKTRPP